MNIKPHVHEVELRKLSNYPPVYLVAYGDQIEYLPDGFDPYAEDCSNREEVLKAAAQKVIGRHEEGTARARRVKEILQANVPVKRRLLFWRRRAA